MAAIQVTTDVPPLESSANESAKRPEVFWQPEADPRFDYGKLGTGQTVKSNRASVYSSGVGRLYAEDLIVKIEGATCTMIVSV